MSLYKLILTEHSQLSPDGRASVRAALDRSLGCSEVLIIESLLDQPEVLISGSSNLADIEVLSAELSRCGAQVQIVVSSDEAQVPLPASSAFGRFYERYSEGLFAALNAVHQDEVEDLVERMIDAREHGRQIFVIGNGGSAATASHWANDLSKERFSDDRARFRVISLTDNLPWITATANDFGYDRIFENQLKNLMQEKDLLIAISSSGNSENILRAVSYANSKGATSVGIVGFGGGKLADMAHRTIFIPSKKGHYGFMEDVTSILGHIVSIYIYEQDCERFT
jgi:D-sedoheptulose 7-phosphate isomerase